MWTHFVQRVYIFHLLERIGELVMLAIWTFSMERSELLWRFCWSLVCVFTLKDLVRVACHLRGYTFILKKPASYFLLVWHYADLAAIFLSLYFVSSCMRENRAPSLFAVVVFFRWIQFLYSFRAFGAGSRIIAILNAFCETTGMLFIALLTFFGILHALLLVNNQPVHKSARVYIETFKLLTLSEGDTIDPLLDFGTEDDNASGTWFTWICAIVSVFVYCICLLNIFIAVLNKAYKEAHDSAMPRFLQARARICLQSAMQPHLSNGAACGKLWSPCLLLLATAVPVWAVLLCDPKIHPVLPSILLFVAVSACRAILLQRPWQGNASEDFLWWSARTRECDDSGLARKKKVWAS